MLDGEGVVAKLEELGWAQSLDEVAWQGICERVRAADEEAYLGIAAADFDTECIDGTGPDDGLGSYHAVIEMLGERSGGKFTPTNIVDEVVEDETRMRVAFDFAGARHEVLVELQSDWFQIEVIELINEALEQAGVAERFSVLPVLDQVAYLAFVPPALLDQAVEAGVIPSIEELSAEYF